MLRKTDIAKELAVSIATVTHWIRSGDLEAIDVRKRGASQAQWRIKREDFDAFVRKRSNAKVERKTRPSKPAIKHF